MKVGILCSCPNPEPTIHHFAVTTENIFTEAEIIATLNRFKIIDDNCTFVKVLGKGGFGTVVQVWNTTLARAEAIKIITPSHSDDVSMKRFIREAQILSQLDHPNIVRVYRFGQFDEGRGAFIIMEFMDGKPLDEVVRKRGPLSAETFRRVFSQAANALEALRTHGIVHRDVKAANLILTGNDAGSSDITLVDFGLSKRNSGAGSIGEPQALTALGESVGTPGYMSPEQCRGLSVDVRSDIYSLGCVMYEAFTGSLPFVSDNFYELMMKHTIEQPTPVQVMRRDLNTPVDIAETIAQAMAKDPNDRFQTPAEIVEQLKSTERGATPIANVASAFLIRKKRSLVRSRLFVVLAIATGCISFLWLMFSVPTLREHGHAVGLSSISMYRKLLDLDATHELNKVTQTQPVVELCEAILKQNKKDELLDAAQIAYVLNTETQVATHTSKHHDEVMYGVAAIKHWRANNLYPFWPTLRIVLKGEEVLYCTDDLSRRKVVDLVAPLIDLHVKKLQGRIAEDEATDALYALARLYICVGDWKLADQLILQNKLSVSTAIYRQYALTDDAILELHRGHDDLVLHDLDRLRAYDSIPNRYEFPFLRFRASLGKGPKAANTAYTEAVRISATGAPDQCKLLLQAATGKWADCKSTLQKLHTPAPEAHFKSLCDWDLRKFSEMARKAGQADLANMALVEADRRASICRTLQ